MKKLVPFIFFIASFLFVSQYAAAANVTLGGLSISAGTLSPSFISTTTTYTAAESDATASITVKATQGATGQSIYVNGTLVTSGISSGAIALSPGANVITITVKNNTSTGTYTINVNREGISYAGSPFTYYTGGAISAAAPTLSGDTPTSYTYSLPAGLSVNASGNITGTPTAVSPAANYTITANYGGGITATSTVNITVLAPTISYTGSPFTYYRGTAITALACTATGPTPTSFTGTLPAGLTLGANGTISGTPTAVSAASNYTITANYAGGVTATATLNITILAPTIYYLGTPYTFYTGVAIPTLSPTASGSPVSYSISPALSAGLSFATATGAITGVPSAVAPSTTYTIQANYAGGVTASTTIKITVNLGPPIISYSPSVNVYTTGTAITTLTPANTGGASTAFSITPGLPAGLSFDTNTGAISGVPTATSPATNYTITAVNFGGSGTTTITITVNPPPPVISYSPSTVTDVVGTASAAMTPASTGGAVANYSISPGLPAGLSFDANTGIISGTPTALSSAANYTVTATNAGGSATAVVNITVLPVAPVISYTPSTNVYTVGTAITPLTPVNTGGTATSYLIGPSLPAGLSFNASTGEISGTPLATSPVTKYTISAENSGGIGTATVYISCSNPTPPVIAYSPSSQIYVVGTTVASWAPTNSGGAATSYSISGTLPDGLLFSTSTGAITGTPTTVTSLTSYTVTATNSAGSASATINITVNPQAPSFTYNPLSNTYTYGTTITTLTPVNSGGAPASYAITSGTLPAGLSFNTATGAISGTPTVTSFSGNITVTATNVTGSAQVVVTISVNNLGPTISYSPAINIFPVGATITPLTPTSTGGMPSSYAITSGTLPAGLSFNTSTGVISGTPTTETASPVNLTIKASNSTGSNSATVQITVSPHAPVISYTPSTNVYSVNVAITTLTPTNTGGAVLGYSYSSTGTSLTGATLSGPSLMTIDASGNIYVANWNSSVHTISKWNSSGTYVGTYGPTSKFTDPEGIVFDSAGNAYILDTSNTGAIYKLDASGNYVSTIVSNLGHPLGIAIDPSDHLFVASYNTTTNVSSLIEYNTSGTQLLSLNNSNMNQADGVATDAAGNIYVLNRALNMANPTSAGYVEKYSPSGVDLGLFASGFNDPLAISIDPSGNVFVADSHNNQIEIYNSSGGLLNTIHGFTDVEGFVADANGNLYVSDFTNNTVKEFTAMGGYHINAPLPSGLSFNSTTGQITGTPTSTFPATTYTITAYNVTGSGSTTVTLSCVNSFDWIGTTSTDWNTGSNWLSGVVPGSSDQALIGVNKAFTNYPNVLTATGTVNVGSIKMGNLGGRTPGVIVNSGATLNVSGAVTYQSDANSGLNYTATLSGSGTFNAGSIAVISDTVLSASYTTGLASSVGALNVSGNISLTSGSSGSKLFNAAFSLTAGTAALTGILQTSNTASSSSTFAVTPSSSATLKLAGTAALSGLSATGTNVVTFNNSGATVEYSGAAQTVYTDAAIAGLASGVSYQSITFSGSGIKKPSAGNLNVAGNFTNNLANDGSNYVDFSATTANFNGTTQSLVPGLSAATGTTFYAVNFSGAGTKTISTGQMYIASSGVLTMVGSNASTILAAGGLLTLKSDATGSATVAAMSGPSITGSVNVQRYISARRGYRLLSSPVYAATVSSVPVCSLNYLGSTLWLTGSNPSGGFDKVSNPTIYLFREDQIPYQYHTFVGGNWWGISAINNTPSYNYGVTGQVASGTFNLPAGNGYLLFFRGDKSLGTLSAQTQVGAVATAATLSASGSLIQGQVVVHDWQTASSPYLAYSGSGAGTNSAVRGYSLVGNPYASSIDWEQMNSTASTSGIYTQNIDATIYELNPVTLSYDTYQLGGVYTNHGRRVIVSGESFFVKALNGSQPQLIFNESAKLTAQNTGLDLFMSADKNIISPASAAVHPHLRVQMYMDSIYTDDTYIGLGSSFKDQYAEREDALHFAGAGRISIASLSSDSVELAINKRSMPGAARSSVRLMVSAAVHGTYKLNLTEQEGIPKIYDIWLKDNYKKDSVNFRHDTSYTFEITSDVLSSGNKRFELVFGQDTALALKLTGFSGSKVAGGSQLQWTVKNEQNYTHFTLERSIDGGASYQIVGGFPSTGNGSYGLLDRNPGPGRNMYRLRLEDLNGVVTHSGIVTLMYGSGQAANNPVILYPNPASNVIHLNINMQSALMSTGEVGSPLAAHLYGIKIISQKGQVVKSETITQTEWQTNISELLPGTYIFQVTDNNKNVFIGKTTFVKL